MTFALPNIPYGEVPNLVLFALSIAGIGALCFGGDWLARGAAGISVRLNINPVIVGLTVVSIATSMPEMLTSFIAVKDNPGLVTGNIVGSNIANIGLILGVSAILTPIAVRAQLIRRDVPILIGVTLLFVVFGTRGYGNWEGFALITIFVWYLGHNVYWVVREPSGISGEFDDVRESARKSLLVLVMLLVAGGLALALGAEILVRSSVELAGRMGVSDVLVGITLVAVGTSLPELAASVAAALRGHSDICAGNIVGSNLVNIVLIGGSVASLTGLPVEPSLFRIEFPAMLFLTVLLLFLFGTGHTVSRKEGVFLLALYAGIIGLSAGSQMNLF